MEGFYGKMVEYIPDLWKLQEEPHLMENKSPDGSVNDSEDSNHIITLLTESWNNYTSSYLGSIRFDDGGNLLAEVGDIPRILIDK